MAHKLENKQNVTAPNSTFPFGDIKDNPGNNTGTPFNRAVYGDFHQYFAKMLYESGITPNNQDENAVNGFQYFNALKLTSREFTKVQLVTTTPYDPSADYSATPEDAYKTIFKVVALGAYVFNLPPSASLLEGAPVSIVHQGSFGNSIQILPNGSDSIGGSADFILVKPGDCVQLINDPTNTDWIISITNINTGSIFTGESVHSGAITNLAPTEAGNLIVYGGSGAGTFNLWNLSAYDRAKKVIIYNSPGGGGLLTISTPDTFLPLASSIILNPGDSVTLEASDSVTPFAPCWNVLAINRVNQSKPVITPALGAGWSGTAKYYCDDAGIVHLSGTLTYAVTTPSYVSPFSLNPGYRPIASKKIPTVIDDSYQTVMVPGRIDIATSGVVSLAESVNANPNTLTVYLDGISFYKGW